MAQSTCALIGPSFHPIRSSYSSVIMDKRDGVVPSISASRRTAESPTNPPRCCTANIAIVARAGDRGKLSSVAKLGSTAMERDEKTRTRQTQAATASLGLPNSANQWWWQRGAQVAQVSIQTLDNAEGIMYMSAVCQAAAHGGYFSWIKWPGREAFHSFRQPARLHRTPSATKHWFVVTMVCRDLGGN